MAQVASKPVIGWIRRTQKMWKSGVGLCELIISEVYLVKAHLLISKSENTYVRVTGNLKTFGNKRYINAQHIRPSTNPHELYFHLGEAMVTNLMIERGMVSIDRLWATTSF
jgi:hypothetical protein